MDQSLAPAAAAIDKQLGFKFVSITELPEEQKQVLKDTVAKGTTDTELTYFLNVAFAQELDPFRKEVWCVKYGNNLMIQTARDGFLKIAKRDPTFDRIQSAEVRQGDLFRMDPISGEIEHRIEAQRGDIVGAYAVITRKDGTRLSKYVTFSEYNDSSSNIWKDYPSAMICKCAESVLCKQFANVTGIVAEETIRRDGSAIDSSPAAQEKQLSLKADLLQKIAACKTLEQFNALKQTMPGVIGKLFGAEKDEVFAAAKKKGEELAGVQDAVIVEEKKPEEPITDDEAQEFLEGLRAQETLEGLDTLWEVVRKRKTTIDQYKTLQDAYGEARAELTQPSPKAA